MDVNAWPAQLDRYVDAVYVSVACGVGKNAGTVFTLTASGTVMAAKGGGEGELQLTGRFLCHALNIIWAGVLCAFARPAVAASPKNAEEEVRAVPLHAFSWGTQPMCSLLCVVCWLQEDRLQWSLDRWVDVRLDGRTLSYNNEYVVVGGTKPIARAVMRFFVVVFTSFPTVTPNAQALEAKCDFLPLRISRMW